MPSRTRTKRPQLSAFIAAKRMTDDRSARRRSPLEVGASASPHFTPQRHGLSPEQCRLANALLRKAEQERPLSGDSRQRRFRHAMRCAGIVSAIRRNLVGNTRFGHHLMGYRGGRVMQRHGLHILRTIAPIGHLASLIAHERRQAAQYFEATGEVLAPGTRPPQTKEEARVRHLITLWEAAEWQQQRDRLTW